MLSNTSRFCNSSQLHRLRTSLSVQFAGICCKSAGQNVNCGTCLRLKQRNVSTVQTAYSSLAPTTFAISCDGPPPSQLAFAQGLETTCCIQEAQQSQFNVSSTHETAREDNTLPPRMRFQTAVNDSVLYPMQCTDGNMSFCNRRMSAQDIWSVW